MTARPGSPDTPGTPAGNLGASAQLRVDFVACDGRGLCAEALPELITLDDWGFPIVSGRPVPPGCSAMSVLPSGPARSSRSASSMGGELSQ